MDIEIISLIDGISSNLKGFAEEKVSNKDFRKNKYYRINDKNIQISFLQEEDMLTYKAKAKKKFILIKEINEIKQKLLLDFICDTTTVVLTEDYNCCNKSLKHVNILKDIKTNASVDSEALLFFAADNDIFKAIHWGQNEKVLITGKAKKENITSQVVMTTLKQLNQISTSKTMDLYLYGNDELNLKELSYIEDPLREYLNFDKLRIKQRKNVYTNKYIYFILICSAK